jgi:tRNA-dihydrouridine synthase B
MDKIILSVKKSINSFSDKKNKIILSSKIRKPDFSYDDERYKILLSCLSKVDYVFIHGRTRCQMYSGISDWNFILRFGYELKKINPKVKIIGNGDIKGYEDIINHIKQDNYKILDGFMIGREALKNPLIFSNIKAKINSKEISCDDIIKAKKKYIKFLLRFYLKQLKSNDEKSISKFVIYKNLVIQAISGINHSKLIKSKLMKTKTIFELKEVFDEM